MYPRFVDSTSIHYFGEKAIVTTTDLSLFLNTAEKMILQQVDGKTSILEIVSHIADHFSSVEKDRIISIVNRFIKAQVDRGMLTYEDFPRFYFPRRTGIEGYHYPLSVMLEITNRCNLKCTHCYKEAGYGKKDDISAVHLIEKLRQLESNVVDIQITGGEPMSHPRFFDLLDYCKNHYATSITTTATMITKRNIERFSGLDTIQVSLYSDNEVRHEAVTLVQNSYQRTIEGIRLLTEYHHPVTVSSIVTQFNYRNLEPIIQLCSSLGVDAIKFGTFSRYGRGISVDKTWELTPDQDREATMYITELAMKYKSKIKVYDWAEDNIMDKPVDKHHGGFACGAGNLAWVISEYGNIKPCVFLPEDRFTIGNIFEDDIREICKTNQIGHLFTGLADWEAKLNTDGMSTEDVCPVMKNYLDYFQQV